MIHTYIYMWFQHKKEVHSVCWFPQCGGHQRDPMGGASQLYACASLKAIREPTGWIWDGLANSSCPATVTKYFPANSCVWVFAQVCTHWWHWYVMVLLQSWVGAEGATAHSGGKDNGFLDVPQGATTRVLFCPCNPLHISTPYYAMFYAMFHYDL